MLGNVIEYMSGPFFGMVYFLFWFEKWNLLVFIWANVCEIDASASELKIPAHPSTENLGSKLFVSKSDMWCGKTCTNILKTNSENFWN